MRRKDKEITDSKEIRQIIEDAVYCNVAMCQNNNPYVVPMNFGFTFTQLMKVGKLIF